MKTNENRLQWKPSLSRSVAITAEQWVFRQHRDIVFLFPNKKKLFAPEYSKSIFAFIKTRMMNIIKSTKIKQGYFSFVIFFWLRYSLKLSSWFQEESLLSSWKKKNSWLQNVTILGTVSVQFRYECHGQRFILFPSSLCTFSHRLTNKCHKEGSKHFAEMPTWISGHTVFTISCRDISLSFMISTKTTCIWLLNPLRFFFFFVHGFQIFFYDRFFKWSMQRI